MVRWNSDRIAVFLTGMTLVLHLSVANRYNLLLDELYFIACGRHPAFGYVDQPPLVPLLSAGLYALGAQTWLLRLPAVLSAAGIVWLTIAFTRLLGGRATAAWLAGIAAMGAPLIVGLSATFYTSTLEPIAWTAVAYALARVILLNDRRALLWAGATAGVALEAKYLIPLWLTTLGFGLFVTAQRKAFAYREMWVGLAVATALAVPSLIWQALHGWPFIDLLSNVQHKIHGGSTDRFMRQIWQMNPLLAPIWIAGVIAPFVMKSLARVRFLSIAFVACFVAFVVLHGKDWYFTAAYPSMFAIGAVSLERLVTVRWIRIAYASVAAVSCLIVLPLTLPLLDLPQLIAYDHSLFHSGEPARERADGRVILPGLFALEFGWHDLVRSIAIAYDAVPPGDRARTSILVDGDAEAAAIDVYGPAYGLPPALSGHNQYFFWGLRGQDPRNVLFVHGSRADPIGRYTLHPTGASCAKSIVLGTTQSRYGPAYEDEKTISLCTAMQPDLAQIWPLLKNIY